MGIKQGVSTILLSGVMGAAVLAGGIGSAAANQSQPPLTIVANDSGLFQENFNPFTSSPDAGTFGLMYESLFYFSRVNGKTWPLLGTKYAWGNGGKTLTVHLRKGVHWSDGKSFTASDVLFTFNYLKKWPSIDSMGIWKEVTSVVADNNFEVTFNFSKVDTPFMYYVLQNTPIIPEHIWSKLSGDPSKLVNTTPVGTGPYVLKSFTPQAYFFKPNNGYWGGRPAVQNVEYPAYNGNDSWALAFAAGKIVWGGGFMPNIDKTWVAKDAQHRHYWFPPDSPVVLYLNNNAPEFSNAAVRKAISLAINREPLAKIAEYGYEQVSSPTGLVLPNNKAWLDKSIPKSELTFNFNPTAAQKLLSSAGYSKDSNGMWQKNGKELKFNLNVVAGWTDWDEMAQMISDNLRNIGIEADVRQLQFGDYFSQQNTGKYQASISWSIGGPTPFTFYQNLLGPKNPNNFEKFIDGTATYYIDKWQHSADVKVQTKASHELEKLMINQVPSVLLVDGATWYEYDTSHYTGFPTSSNPYVDPAPYAYQGNGILLMHLKPAK